MTSGGCYVSLILCPLGPSVHPQLWESGSWQLGAGFTSPSAAWFFQVEGRAAKCPRSLPSPPPGGVSAPGVVASATEAVSLLLPQFRCLLLLSAVARLGLQRAVGNGHLCLVFISFPTESHVSHVFFVDVIYHVEDVPFCYEFLSGFVVVFGFFFNLEKVLDFVGCLSVTLR